LNLQAELERKRLYNQTMKDLEYLYATAQKGNQSETAN
jgi:hypothetical protein